MQKQDNSCKASNNVIKFVTPKLLVVRHVSSPQGSSLYTKQSANYGLLLTNILLANILATECMIRMWWTGNLAVLRSACGGLLPAPADETQSDEAGGEQCRGSTRLARGPAALT